MKLYFTLYSLAAGLLSALILLIDRESIFFVLTIVFYIPFHAAVLSCVNLYHIEESDSLPLIILPVTAVILEILSVIFLKEMITVFEPFEMSLWGYILVSLTLVIYVSIAATMFRVKLDLVLLLFVFLTGIVTSYFLLISIFFFPVYSVIAGLFLDLSYNSKFGTFGIREKMLLWKDRYKSLIKKEEAV